MEARGRGCWSRWSIYEYMKYRFVRTGQIPNREELLSEFEEIDSTELAEGMAEFTLVVGKWGPEGDEVIVH